MAMGVEAGFVAEEGHGLGDHGKTGDSTTQEPLWDGQLEIGAQLDYGVLDGMWDWEGLGFENV